MEFINIGKVCGTHSLDGRLKCVFFYNVDDLFSYYPYVLLRGPSTISSFRLEKFFRHKYLYIFKLVGINNIDTAARYKDFAIILPIILKDYIEELDDKNNLGLKVFDENDQYVGEIYEYYNFNGNVVFKINCDKKYYLISYNKEHVVSENFIQHKLTVLRFGLVEHNI